MNVVKVLSIFQSLYLESKYYVLILMTQKRIECKANRTDLEN